MLIWIYFKLIFNLVSVDTTKISTFDIMKADEKIFLNLLQFIKITFTILYALYYCKIIVINWNKLRNIFDSASIISNIEIIVVSTDTKY